MSLSLCVFVHSGEYVDFFCVGFKHFSFICLFCGLLTLVYASLSPREIRKGEEIAWYADGETIVRNENNQSIAYAYG